MSIKDSFQNPKEGEENFKSIAKEYSIFPSRFELLIGPRSDGG